MSQVKQSVRAEHTPGPWELRGDYVTDAMGQMVAATSASGAFAHKDEWVAMNATFMSGANARLIAAAPELLEALKAILDGQLHGSVDLYAARFEAGRAAIRKAEQSE